MDTPWLAHYQPGVPQTIHIPASHSLVDLFQTTCQTHAARIAFENFGETLSYQTLYQEGLTFAAFLQQAGLKKGDRVAIMMPNLLQYPVALLGILLAGGVVVNTNPLYTATELTHQLNDAEASFLLVLNYLSPLIQKALPDLPHLKHIILTGVGDYLPFYKRWGLQLYLKYIQKQPSPCHLPRSVTFKKAMHIGKTYTFKPVSLTGKDLAFLQYTGGTTGISKGAMLSHHNMLSNIEQAYTWILPAQIGASDIVITALPLYHIFALTANCLTFLKAGARNVLITNPRHIGQLIRTLKRKRFTTITGVNTLFNALTLHPGFKKIDFSHLKLALSGGMALQQTVAERWEALTKSRILEAYGLTETCPAVTINPMYVAHHNGSIGLPLPSTFISIRDEANRPLPHTEVGELCIKGPQVMQGYWRQPQETALVFTTDGFLKTGDLAKMDDQGFIYLVDRKKDLIIVSGFNVYPNEVEQVISTHPDVLEVGVTGMVDDTGNERVKAFVVKRHEALTASALIAYCRQYLTPYKVPKCIEFTESLPKTTVGKILRRALS